MSDLEKILISRDGMSASEAREAVQEMYERVLEGEDPEEILLNDYGLEADYVFDIL